jgi:hypothetical protein
VLYCAALILPRSRLLEDDADGGSVTYVVVMVCSGNDEDAVGVNVGVTGADDENDVVRVTLDVGGNVETNGVNRDTYGAAGAVVVDGTDDVTRLVVVATVGVVAAVTCDGTVAILLHNITSVTS